MADERPAYFLLSMALVVAFVATVAWSARYQRRPFHTRFKHGLATLESGAIRFVSYAGGVRFLPRKPVCVAVVAMDLSDQRSVVWKEALSAKPGLRVVKVRAQMATLECVLLPEQTAWVAQQISPH